MTPRGFDIMPGVDGQLFTGSRNSAAGLNQQRWAKITGSAGMNPVLYSWVEQTWQHLPAGNANTLGLANMDGGMFGSTTTNPAVEPNGAQLNVGDFVLIEAAYFDPALDMVFAVIAKGAGAGTNIFGNAFLGTVSIAPNVATAFPWGNGRAEFWNAGQPTQFLIPASQPNGGLYNVIGTIVGINTVIKATYVIGWQQNGVIVGGGGGYDGSCTGGGGSQQRFPPACDSFICNPGDFLELYIEHDAPGNTTFNGISARIEYEGVY